MDQLELDFRFVVDTARRSIRLHLAELEEQSSATGDDTPALARRLEAELNKYDNDITTRWPKFLLGDDADRESLTSFVRTRANELARLEAPVTWCHRGAPKDVSLAQLYFAQEAASAIVGARSEVLVVLSAESGFATPVPIKKWTARPAHGAAEPVVVFAPPQETRTTMLLPLLAHEVAHTAIATHSLLVRVKDQIGPDWSSAVDEAAGFMEAQTGTARAAAVLHVDTMLERWTVELLCDALATAYCGTSYLYAFCAAVLGRELAAPSHGHPPASERVSSIIELLARMGHDPTEALSPNDPSIGEPGFGAWLAYVSNAPVHVDDTRERILRQCTAMRTKLHDLVLSHLAGEQFGARQLAAQAPIEGFLADRIVAAQAETGDHMDRRAILHAAWLLAFREGGPVPHTMPLALDDLEFQAMLERSIELSYVVERWNQRPAVVT